jgi:hypothetical protein
MKEMILNITSLKLNLLPYVRLCQQNEKTKPWTEGKCFGKTHLLKEVNNPIKMSKNIKIVILLGK